MNKPLKTKTISSFSTADISPVLFAVLIVVVGLFGITGFDTINSLTASEKHSFETLSLE